MKRVVKDTDTVIIETPKCGKDMIYLLCSVGEWFILSRCGHNIHNPKEQYQWQSMDNSFTVANGAMTDVSIQKVIERGIDLDAANQIYQFPDFRSAMQYYLEQTK